MPEHSSPNDRSSQHSGLDRLGLEDFLPHVGSQMEISAHGQRAHVTLKEAAPIMSPSPRATPPFHLVLGAPPTWRMPQGLFRLAHPRLGELDLFAVPIGPHDGEFCYEVIFN